MSETLEEIQNHEKLNAICRKAFELYDNDNCIILSQSECSFEFLVTEKEEDFSFCIEMDGDGKILPYSEIEGDEWGSFGITSLLQLEKELKSKKNRENSEHKKYTRQGMVYRVLNERKIKAANEDYRIEWADNVFGDHLVYNNKGSKYKVFLRDFENETGYSNSPDARTNKLGTTKHVMAVFHKLKSSPTLRKRMDKECPFVEIYLDPLHGNLISWFYPHPLAEDAELLINKYFGAKNFVPENKTRDFLPFLEEAAAFESLIKIRPEVHEKIDKYYEEEMLGWVEEKFEIPFGEINATLYPYQKEGISFVTFKKGCILADEMGLGKTLQALSAAIAKKSIFSFKKTLIVCPASLKDQWKKEIEKFSEESAEIIQGTPEERAEQYRTSNAYFLITNYEAVRRDSLDINKATIDFLILDEAQRIKNFETKTWSAINRVQKKHILILSGTPIENKLVDLFSVMQTIDPAFLGPLWEFSYQHCLFDHERPNKINAYYDLQKFKRKLEPILLRREKRKVLEQLPNINQFEVAVELSPLQQQYHASYAGGISKILRKKFLTPADTTRLMMLMTSMRMVCNSTFLIDQETNDSTKLEELKYILTEKLDIQNSNNKVIIFSEWVKCHKLIGEILREKNIGFTELNGTVPVKKRGALIKKFETDDDCKVFLSTEAGGSGLNLQVADTLINFELPWNPAKRNQRIGRIDRLGQKNTHLTVIDIIAKNSIETKIASGLIVKQNLFDGVLNDTDPTDFVDFSEKGRSQFLQELEKMVSDFDLPNIEEEVQKESIQEESDEQLILYMEEGEAIGVREVTTNDLIQEEGEAIGAGEATTNDPVQEEGEKDDKADHAQQLEEVMNQGMGFLSGLYKMSTGQEMSSANQKIEVNKETGEVTMKFKLPGF
ncbi:MAG: DEAD/DEAH box helicase [Cytophagales bacterium]|nr:DEAD/DEAH box helicase [Cytophagales bacterium]